MQKDKNAFIKILIVLVIASLALLAIVYLMQNARRNSDHGVINGLGEVQFNDQEEPSSDDIIGGGPLMIKGDSEFLNINNYYYLPEVNIDIDFCETNDLSQYIKLANEYDNQAIKGGVLSRYEEEYDITLKIIKNNNWTNSEVQNKIMNNECGISDSYIGMIGTNNEYLLFASNCSAAFNTSEAMKANLCEERLAEIKEIMSLK